ncbi:MAG: Xaa-Pro peptidase family protein, partial [Firmicutes bacterium]|nr:Xaa-Pro peptidase family protein [Bacillota bacterium]
RRESALENVVPLENLKDLPGKLLADGYNLKRIGFELDVLPAGLYLYYQKLFNPAEILDASLLIRTVRAVKSPYELELLRNAAKMNHTLFSCVREFLREGITEVEFAAKLEEVYRREGHQGYVRMRGFNQEIVYGHLMSGWNLATPSTSPGPTGGSGLNPSFPQGAGLKVIGRDEPVMVDYVGVCDGYMVDQARIFCIGKLSEKLEYAHGVALEIQELLKNEGKTGVVCGELYDMAVQVAGDRGLKDNFMGYPEPVPFVGHGVGIELDELPVLARGVKTPLQEGMVVALEPKFVFPEGAAGIENTFVVTKDGLETLTVFDEDIIYL